MLNDKNSNPFKLKKSVVYIQEDKPLGATHLFAPSLRIKPDLIGGRRVLSPPCHYPSPTVSNTAEPHLVLTLFFCFSCQES